MKLMAGLSSINLYSNVNLVTWNGMDRYVMSVCS